MAGRDQAADNPERGGVLSHMKTQAKDVDVVFLSAVRTSFGTFGGTLKDFTAIDLAAAAAKAGLPIETPGLTVNRLCGSGFEAITQGAQQILLGESNAVLCGGGESMSQAPHVVRGARWGLRLGPPAPLEDLL